MQQARSGTRLNQSSRVSPAATNILLTEDQPEVQSIARAILTRHGYTVLPAASGEEALRILGEHPDRPIHVLLTDVVMPSMSGPDLARRVRSSRPEVAVLYMSGYTDDAIVRQGVLEAGVAFIQKPFTPDGLLRRIRDVLNTQRSPLNSFRGEAQ